MSNIFMRTLAPLVVIIATRGVAYGQPSGPPTKQVETRAAELAGGEVARLTVTWARSDAGCSARLKVPGIEPVTLHGGPAAATLVAGHGLVLAAYAFDHAREPFHVRVVTREGEGYRVGPPVGVARPVQRRDSPFAVVATAVPDGFAVFFQEVEVADPTAAHTYLLRTDVQGAPQGPAVEVRVPWSLADASWNGHGFHLALIYPGDASGMRLSMVSLTETGTPQQHPDWSSRAGFITDVHLAFVNGRVLAFYRGGRGGTRLLERDVTQIGAWGRDPPRARDHGELARDNVIVVALQGSTARPRRVEVD